MACWASNWRKPLSALLETNRSSIAILIILLFPFPFGFLFHINVCLCLYHEICIQAIPKQHKRSLFRYSTSKMTFSPDVDQHLNLTQSIIVDKNCQTLLSHSISDGEGSYPAFFLLVILSLSHYFSYRLFLGIFAAPLSVAMLSDVCVQSDTCVWIMLVCFSMVKEEARQLSSLVLFFLVFRRSVVGFGSVDLLSDFLHSSFTFSLVYVVFCCFRWRPCLSTSSSLLYHSLAIICDTTISGLCCVQEDNSASDSIAQMKRCNSFSFWPRENQLCELLSVSALRGEEGSTERGKSLAY